MWFQKLLLIASIPDYDVACQQCHTCLRLPTPSPGAIRPSFYRKMVVADTRQANTSAIICGVHSRAALLFHRGPSRESSPQAVICFWWVQRSCKSMRLLQRWFSWEPVGVSAWLFQKKLMCCRNVRLAQVQHIYFQLEISYSVWFRMVTAWR